MQKPVADQGADDADRCVADETEATAAYDLARQPSGNDPDDQNDNQSLVGQMHGLAFAIRSDSRRRRQHCKEFGPRTNLGDGRLAPLRIAQFARTRPRRVVLLTESDRRLWNRADRGPIIQVVAPSASQGMAPTISARLAHLDSCGNLPPWINGRHDGPAHNRSSSRDRMVRPWQSAVALREVCPPCGLPRPAISASPLSSPSGKMLPRNCRLEGIRRQPKGLPEWPIPDRVQPFPMIARRQKPA